MRFAKSILKIKKSSVRIVYSELDGQIH